LNIAIFSTVSWDFLWQRQHHVASELAKKGHSVVYFDDPVYVSSSIFLKRIIAGNKLFEVKKITDNISVVVLYLPEFRGRLSGYKNSFLRSNFKACMKKLSFVPDVSIFYSLDFVALIKTLETMRSKIAYDCVDDALSFVSSEIKRHLRPESAYSQYLNAEVLLIKSSSVCFATANLLYEKILKHNPKCVYLPNAMDFDHFNSAAKGIVTLDELSTLRHPVIGFIGALYNWIDVDLICRIAEVHPEYSVLLVGPVAAESNQLEKYSNIVTVGAKPYGILPSYLSNIDVCIIPFKLNDITLASNPIKMYEYLAAGKPVVSTALPEVVKVASDLVYVGKDEVDFIKKIEMATLELEHNNGSSVTARMNFARKNSWESRVEVMEKFLNELVTNK